MNYDQKNDAYYDLMSLPGAVKGLCYSDNGCFYILINSSLSEAEREKTYKHELEHRRRNDLYSDRPTYILEEECEKDIRDDKASGE